MQKHDTLLHYFFRRSNMKFTTAASHFTDNHVRCKIYSIRVYFLMPETAEGYRSGLGVPNDVEHN